MATAPVRPRINLEELCRLPSFYLPTLSWGGDRLAFYGDRTGRLELYVMDLKTRAIRQVSGGELPRALRAGFAWDRSDRFIVFAKDAEGNEQHDLYRVDVATGAVTRLTHDPGAQEYPVQFSPDNAWLTVVSNKRHPRAPDRPGQINLWRLRADASEYQPLTRYANPASGGLWSPDSEWLCFVTNEDARNLRNRDGYLIRPDGSDARKVFSLGSRSQDLLVDWHPDSRRMAVTSDASGVHRAGILDIQTHQVRWLSAEGVEESAVGFSRSGRHLAALRNQEATVVPVVYEVESGRAQVLQLPPGIAFQQQDQGAGARLVQFVDGDTHLLVTHHTATSRPALILYDLGTDRYETLIAPAYGALDPSVFAPARHVRYPSFDGRSVPGILYSPRDLPGGVRVPALVHVHGGPTAQWYRGFDAYAQFLVDRGFVVLAPNIRGSTGYGVAWRDAALKEWGGADLEDVAAGARYLQTLPFVDPGRLVVMGGSYGGYMTFMAVTRKPDLWRAAVAMVGITDLARMYAKSMEHFRYFLREQMGDPERDAALWADRSAISFAQNLQARLLIIHGANDPRCPVDQSRIFRDRLLELGRREGVDFEYVEFGDVGHGSVDIAYKVRVFSLLADYLGRVL